ncbi:MAG TPA: helix-turn-helix domain-containing protein, partial [Thermoanaerobaculia bacterium]|nr:helix-turn-helix domain-containing protein [Thermoanaerobaculia bacterium]HQN38857.1 helix-turn-helix domain-containing protein [Thermoanaerobaculia bacterium]
LSRTGGNVRAAAALLGLTPQGLRYKRKRLGLA